MRQDFPKNDFTNRFSILTAYRGSVAHGMYVPNSSPTSIDDIDLMCIDVLPLDHYWGSNHYQMNQGTLEFKEGEWDIVCYEFRKFLALLKKGNPNVIGMLWLEKEHYLAMSPVAQTLIANRGLFNSKLTYHSFVEYAHDQLRKMMRVTHQGYMGEKRKQLVERFGYDTKNAAHCIRLLAMACEWLEEGRFKVYRTTDAEMLLQIKRGEWEMDQVVELAESLFAKAKTLFGKCELPEEPDHHRIDQLSVGILKEHFGWKA